MTVIELRVKLPGGPEGRGEMIAMHLEDVLRRYGWAGVLIRQNGGYPPKDEYPQDFAETSFPNRSRCFDLGRRGPGNLSASAACGGNRHSLEPRRCPGRSGRGPDGHDGRKKP